MKSVLKIVDIQSYSILLEFKNGENCSVPFGKKLEKWSQQIDSKFKTLLNPDYFKTVQYNPELETIEWENGIYFCPNNLNTWSQPENNE